jgi:hypothetical protein
MYYIASICIGTFQRGMHAMNKRSVLIQAGPEHEELEVGYPKYRLEAAGYSAPLVGIGEKTYRGRYGYPCPVDGQVGDFNADNLAGWLASA